MGRSYFHLHLVSDSTGETLIAASRAAAAQYQGVASIEHVYPLVRTAAQLDRVIAEIENAPGIVLFTLVDPELSKRLQGGCEASGSPCLSVLEPILTLFKSYLGQNSTPRAGAQHMLNADYFKRIDALNFSMISDDGQSAENLEHADIVLLGVSRTSKTPTSIYLANRGYKTANVPIVPRLPLPNAIDHLRRPLIVGLIASADRIVQIRQNRLLSLNADLQTDYVDRIAVAEEIAASRRLFADRGWPAIDVTRRSIEETAAAVLDLYRAHRLKFIAERLKAMRELSTTLPPMWRGAAPLVLASRSESRRALLSAAGLDFEFVAPEVDERAVEDRHLARGGSLENVASELAQAKALAVSAERPDRLLHRRRPDAHVRRQDPPQVPRFLRSGANARRALRQDASVDLRILRRPRRASACRPQRSRRSPNAGTRSR